ncbi:hypothetical protein [Spirillospora sp. CA-294931]|uniref:hypothetical protein n=1 Tax=Spirillospora sp. CA-294931 TaxID=3240042 RepID=UPI003D93D482
MAERTSEPDPLAALGAHLGARGFTVELTREGLQVTNPRVAGCCAEVPHVGDTITCRAREEDGGRLWFWTSWGDPIAPADRITDATMVILGNLADRPVGAGAER